MRTRERNYIDSVCLRCMTTEGLTKHHYLPQHRFGKGNHHWVYLCTMCHREVEFRMPKHRVTVAKYLRILAEFLESRV